MGSSYFILHSLSLKLFALEQVQSKPKLFPLTTARKTRKGSKAVTVTEQDVEQKDFTVLCVG